MYYFTNNILFYSCYNTNIHRLSREKDESMCKNYERNEIPRPDFVRNDWINLNGLWDFRFDDDNSGFGANWFKGFSSPQKINVPFCYQCAASGIGTLDKHPVVWYSRTVDLGKEQLSGSALIKVGAADYETDLWVNGMHTGSHRGGHAQFGFEISDCLKPGQNTFVFRVKDSDSCSIPRGKQSWQEIPDRCWYTPTTGIWKSVWLEFTGKTYIRSLRLTPDIDSRLVETELFINEGTNVNIEMNVSFEGKPVQRKSFSGSGPYIRELLTISEQDYVDEIHLWSPDSPKLYDIDICVYENGVISDRVSSYFGMRKIERRGNSIFLNNQKLYQRLVLDQGYWADTLMTPPSDEAIIFDIKAAMRMGFNGVRKHQKFEDPRFYYWADKMGLLVWGELPSAYEFNKWETESLLSEWLEFLEQTYNHPSMIILVPYNESWGIRNVYADERQQAVLKAFYAMTKAMDMTRLVSTNDGWENIEETDIFGIHDYVASGQTLAKRYGDMEQFLKTGIRNKVPLAKGNSYKNQPVLLTEYGGIAFQDGKEDSWGYNTKASGEEDFLQRIDSLNQAIYENESFQGFCYTQLTDVMQETNGLMTMDREFKVSPEKLCRIFNPEKQ